MIAFCTHCTTTHFTHHTHAPRAALGSTPAPPSHHTLGRRSGEQVEGDVCTTRTCANTSPHFHTPPPFAYTTLHCPTLLHLRTTPRTCRTPHPFAAHATRTHRSGGRFGQVFAVVGSFPVAGVCAYAFARVYLQCTVKTTMPCLD